MQDKFFYDLGQQVLTSIEKSIVKAIAVEHCNSFRGYYPKSLNGEPDGSSYLYGSPLMANIAILKILARVSIPCTPMILQHFPGTVVGKHKDEDPSRTTVLTVPIEPEDYSPTYFWESYTSVEPAAVLTFPNMNAALLNTQEFHSITNTSSKLRLTFQLCFRQDYMSIKQKIIDNKFWSKGIG